MFQSLELILEMNVRRNKKRINDLSCEVRIWLFSEILGLQRVNNTSCRPFEEKKGLAAGIEMQQTEVEANQIIYQGAEQRPRNKEH